ncbi:meiotically up-regulated gene 157 (Mug157) protein [Pullulanibacillus pueri]|uniref:Glycosyl hydrolase n=1 Tax=Pullulanibacillus pueri TaxID=1437324 RepID=A0A8J2ZV29_9BACL|nr:glycoside hydrolase family 125 protein [Pullulanibacillus pueri]MBM7681651.1 meiotically up-regulated gene 157 (Mug157) protein [Pullulanibacillus pueri]GGH79306.1 glycosyl hydrolase [Pullulanibacillus pueri]
MKKQVIPDAMEEMIENIAHWNPRVSEYFRHCYSNTYLSTLEHQEDGTTFVITGDIPAMWLRDSAAQVRPYLPLAKANPEMANLIAGVIKKQVAFILKDPYANAFNKEANGHGHQEDLTAMTPGVWERKYEIDSLCYPIQLAYLFWRATGRTDHFTPEFLQAVTAIVELWRVEQDHETASTYRFERKTDVLSDTLSHHGKGSAVKRTGMTWSGFRPSDDACTFGYLVPSNAFATVVLGYLLTIDIIKTEPELLRKIEELKLDIETGIRHYGIYEHEIYGPIYAYETDGYGHFNLMDDANIPSLLSLPYLGFCSPEDTIYQNTRRFILSEENPYFFKGKFAEGIGSPHTPHHFIWPLALSMQGLTAQDTTEKYKLLDVLLQTDGGTQLMHESFDPNHPESYTRPWFSWANAMFCEFVMSLFELETKELLHQAKVSQQVPFKK